MDKIWRLFSGNSNILKFLLSPVRFTQCLGVRVPLRPPRKKALYIYIYIYTKPLKMDVTEGSETCANINQTGNHPKVDILNHIRCSKC
jgi:hypothetical protein